MTAAASGSPGRRDRPIARAPLAPPLLAALLAILFAGLGAGCGKDAPAPPAPPERPKSVVLVLLDTLRADRLSAYGHALPTSPVLDELAQHGVLFEHAVANAAWTLPGMAGIFSGELPSRKVYDRYLRASQVTRIRDAGLRTAAFVEGGLMGAQFGFDLGFDEWHDLSSANLLLAPAAKTVLTEKTFGAARAWLHENADAPFFLVVHSYETHSPYTRQGYTEGLDPGGLGREFQALDARRIQLGEIPFGDTERRYVAALYDGGVRAADQAVGELLATLEELGLGDDTLVVVTSDHGEDIGGRPPEWPGVHGNRLYDEFLRVPLVIHDPTRRFEIARVPWQVRTIDVLPTVLDLLGIDGDGQPKAPATRGRSLVPLMEGREQGHRPAWAKVSELRFFEFGERYALRTGDRKLILTRRPDGGFDGELYDLTADPDERQDLAESDRRTTGLLRRKLMRMRGRLERDGPALYDLTGRKPTEGSEERLRALGYVE